MSSPATWQFGTTEDGVGFANQGVARVTQLSAAPPVRELLQNALDATEPGEVTRVRFSTKMVRWEQLPDRETLHSAIQNRLTFRKSLEHQTVAQTYMTQMQELLDQDSIKLLVVADSGTGIDHGGMQALLSDGTSEKPPGTRGSFGLGHHEMMPASTLRCVMYAARNTEGEIAGGQVTLATGKPGTDGNSAKGFLRRGRGTDGVYFHDLPRDDDIPPSLRWWLDEELEKLGTKTGSIVVIPGFNLFGEDEMPQCQSEIAGAVVRNFVIPLRRRHLDVRITDEIAGGSLMLDQQTVEEQLQARKDRARRTTGQAISGAEAMRCHETLQYGDEHKFEWTRGETIALHVRELAGSENSNVQLHRDGMYITDGGAIGNMPIIRNGDPKLQNLAPHHVIIHVEYQQAPKAAEIIRAGEGPQHNCVTRGNMLPEQIKAADGLFRAIREEIERLVPARQSQTAWTSNWLNFEQAKLQGDPNQRKNVKQKLKSSEFRKARRTRQIDTKRVERKPKPDPNPDMPEEVEASLRMPPGVEIEGATTARVADGNSSRHRIVVHLRERPPIPEAFEIRLERDDARPPDGGDGWAPVFEDLTKVHGDVAGVTIQPLQNRKGIVRAIRVDNPQGVTRIELYTDTNTPRDDQSSWRIHVTEARYEIKAVPGNGA